MWLREPLACGITFMYKYMYVIAVDAPYLNVCCAAGLFIIIWSGWPSCSSGVNTDPEATREHY